MLAAEPVVDATPWWESVCTELAAGRTVDPTRAGLAVQLQAQHFARGPREAERRRTPAVALASEGVEEQPHEFAEDENL